MTQTQPILSYHLTPTPSSLYDPCVCVRSARREREREGGRAKGERRGRVRGDGERAREIGKWV